MHLHILLSFHQLVENILNQDLDYIVASQCEHVEIEFIYRSQKYIRYKYNK